MMIPPPASNHPQEHPPFQPRSPAARSQRREQRQQQQDDGEPLRPTIWQSISPVQEEEHDVEDDGATTSSSRYSSRRHAHHYQQRQQQQQQQHFHSSSYPSSTSHSTSNPSLSNSNAPRPLSTNHPLLLCEIKPSQLLSAFDGRAATNHVAVADATDDVNESTRHRPTDGTGGTSSNCCILETLIREVTTTTSSPALLISNKARCPWTSEAIDLLTRQIGVRTQVLYLDHLSREHPAMALALRQSLQRMLASPTAKGSPRRNQQRRLLLPPPAAAAPPAAAGWQKCFLLHPRVSYPVIFLRQQYIGTTQDLFDLQHSSNKLERTFFYQGWPAHRQQPQHVRAPSSPCMIHRVRTQGTDQFATSQLVVAPLSQRVGDDDDDNNNRVSLLLRGWYPCMVSSFAVRTESLLICFACVLATCFYDATWQPYLIVALLINFLLDALAGPSVLAPLGVVSTLLSNAAVMSAKSFASSVTLGAPHQATSIVASLVTLIALVVRLRGGFGGDIGAASLLGVWSIIAAVQGMFNVNLVGTTLVQASLRWGWRSPASLYREYLVTRCERIQTWRYRYYGPKPPKPIKIHTASSSSSRGGGGTTTTNPIALRYKTKTDEWRKDDFDPIRHMKVDYFSMPMSMGGLSVAFKLSSRLKSLAIISMSENDVIDHRSIKVNSNWFQALGVLSVCLYVFMLFLYLTKALLFPKKVTKEWHDPQRSPAFTCMIVCFMFFGFLIYDQLSNTNADQTIARILYWIGSLLQAFLTIAKVGEWLSRRLELEHVDPSWMLLPLGLGVAAFLAGILDPLPRHAASSVNNLMILRFFLSFSMLLWIAFFILTFFKVLTGHNSDQRQRLGVWHWLSVPCIIGAAEFMWCYNQGNPTNCAGDFSFYFFMGIFFLLIFAWAAFPHLAFFGRESVFHMGYWYVCFALDTLAMNASLFYYSTSSWYFAQELELAALSLATIANVVALLHTVNALYWRRDICTPDVKWGPLSFMKLTHHAMRSSLSTLRFHLEAMDLNHANVVNEATSRDEGIEQVRLFAAHFNRFRIVFEENTHQKEEVLFRAYSDYFPRHPRKFRAKLGKFQEQMIEWCKLAGQLVNRHQPFEVRREAMKILKTELPTFFTRFREHTRGEDENLTPICNKYFSVAHAKDIASEIWRTTSVEKWEAIVPFVLLNLPRQDQRVIFLKSLCWAIPERAQQLGAIVFRSVDDILWDRLQIEIPEMIPRGLSNWRRY